MRRFILSILFLIVPLAGGYFYWKYRTSPVMNISIEEFSAEEYPDDPAWKSARYNQYKDRNLKLVQKDLTHFDFIFTSKDPKVATIAFKDIDLSLFIPICPKWTEEHKELEIIALVDREWNRQQVRFDQSSPHLEINGGDGLENQILTSFELSRNCLNAGLWEILLYTQEADKKALFYHGWFTFPLGHYKAIFEKYNPSSYWKHWFRLEHWWDPEGKPVDLEKLRTVISEKVLPVTYDPDAPLIATGEQMAKLEKFNSQSIRCLGDICLTGKKLNFATFIPPGRYSAKHPWGNELDKITTVKGAAVRKIHSPASDNTLDEIEIVFQSKDQKSIYRFIVSGIELDKIPQLPMRDYPKGLYMPMGIGVSPFSQTYEELKQNPSYQSPYFSLLLDRNNRWINHHRVAIDGPVIHRDPQDPNLYHIYLLSYERHALVGHYQLRIY